MSAPDTLSTVFSSAVAPSIEKRFRTPRETMIIKFFLVLRGIVKAICREGHPDCDVDVPSWGVRLTVPACKTAVSYWCWYRDHSSSWQDWFTSWYSRLPFTIP